MGEHFGKLYRFASPFTVFRETTAYKDISMIYGVKNTTTSYTDNLSMGRSNSGSFLTPGFLTYHILILPACEALITY
jgi:hypothetical protein